MTRRLQQSRWPASLLGDDWDTGVPVHYLRRLADAWRTRSAGSRASRRQSSPRPTSRSPDPSMFTAVDVHNHESGVSAKELMEQIFAVHGVPYVVHAGRGTAMTSKTVAALLADLEITRSHSRPRVSNDNPYSESLFKTLEIWSRSP